MRTIHINHNLIFQSISGSLRTIANKKYSPYNYNVYVDNMNNLEEKCRELRYEELAKNCQKDEAIILGHHLDDQIETFLIRMFRGSSIKGMSSMNNITMMNNVILLRPLLNIKKDHIIAYSKKQSVSYIEDITNVDENTIETLLEKIVTINKKTMDFNREKYS